MASVRDVSTASNQGRLGLGSLGLLAALVGSLLLPHLLVAQGSDSTGELLDLLAGHLFGKGLGEVLEEEAVLGALGVGRKDGTQNCAEVVELSLGLGLEKGQLGNVDSVGRVAGVDDDSSSSGLGPAGADSDVSKHVGGVGEIGLLLGASKSLTLLGLGLLDHLNVGGVGLLLGSVGLVLSNTLALGLLCGGGGFSSLGLGLGSLALLLALYLGVFGGIPRIEDLVRRVGLVFQDTIEREAPCRDLHRYRLPHRQTCGGQQQHRQPGESQRSCYRRCPRRLCKHPLAKTFFTISRQGSSLRPRKVHLAIRSRDKSRCPSAWRGYLPHFLGGMMSSVFFFSGGRKKAVVEDVLRRERCVKEESFVCALCACVGGCLMPVASRSKTGRGWT